MRAVERIFSDAKSYRGSTPQNSWEGRRATKRIERTAIMLKADAAANPAKNKKAKNDEPTPKPNANADKPTTTTTDASPDKGEKNTEEIKAPTDEKTT